MLITVLGYTILIRVRLGVVITNLSLVLASITFVSQFIITYYASNSAEYSKLALLRQMKITRSEVMKKSLKSCRKFGLKSGSFRVIDKEALKIVIMANIDYTVSLLVVKV